MKVEIEARGMNPLMRIINEELGGWPLLQLKQQPNTSNSTTKLSILDRMVRLRRIESSELFPLYVSSNPKNPRKSVLRVSLIYY